MRTFPVQLLFKAVTGGYSNHRAANNNTHTIMVPLNSPGEYIFQNEN